MDNFLDDEELSSCCPLCVTPFDETDARFFACPCKYQVCLFCVNHIRSELNGLCPACRQPYDDDKFVLSAPLEKAAPARRYHAEEEQREDRRGRARRTLDKNAPEDRAKSGPPRGGKGASGKQASGSFGKKGDHHGDPKGSYRGGAAGGKKASLKGGEQSAGGAYKGGPSYGGGSSSETDRLEYRPEREYAALSTVRVVKQDCVFVSGLSEAYAFESILRSKEFFGGSGEIVNVGIFIVICRGGRGEHQKISRVVG